MKHGIASFLIYFMVLSAFGQTVRIGQLPNGLQYYLLGNNEEKATADIRLVMKTGGAHEDATERGLAHFVEHMAFHSSTRLSNNGIHDLLWANAVLQGRGANAYTSSDHTVYALEWPCFASKQMEDGLHLVHDWIDQLEFQQKEVEKEYRVIAMEMRQRAANDSSGRIRLPSPAVQYDVVQLPATTERLAERLRDFYKQTYHANNAALFVSSRYPVGVVEQLVQKLFADLTPGKIPALKNNFFPSDGIAVRSIKDWKSTELSIVLPYVGTGALAVASTDLPVLRKELEDTGGGRVNSEVFKSVENKAMLLLGLDIDKAEQVEHALSVVGQFVKSSGGASKAAQTIASAGLSRAAFMDKATEQFLYHESDTKPICQGLDRTAIGITLLVPAERPALLQQSELAAMWRKVLDKPTAKINPVLKENEETDIDTVEDDGEALEMSNFPIEQRPVGKASNVLSVEQDAKWGIKKMKLSNGAFLLVKHKKGLKETSFKSVKNQGYSALPEDYQAIAAEFPSWMAYGTVGPYDSDQVQNWSLEKEISWNAYVTATQHGFIASVPLQNTTALFRFVGLMNRYPVVPDEEERESWTENTLSLAPSGSVYPPDRLLEYTTKEKDPIKNAHTQEASKNLASYVAIHRSLWGNSSDAYYLLVTDTTMQSGLLDSLIALASVYPATNENDNLRTSPEKVVDSIQLSDTTDKEKLEYSRFIFHATLPSISMQDNYRLQLLEEIYFAYLLDACRREGLAYSPSVSSEYLTRNGQNRQFLQVDITYAKENERRIRQLVEETWSILLNRLSDSFFDAVVQKYSPENRWPYFQDHEWMQLLSDMVATDAAIPFSPDFVTKQDFLDWVSKYWSKACCYRVDY